MLSIRFDMVSETQFQKQVNIIRSVEGAFYKSLRAVQSLIDTYGWGYDDIRISLFGRTSGILNSTVVSFYFLQNHLTHRKWWEVTYGQDFHIFEPSVPDTIKCFEGQAMAALLLGLVSNVESVYRVIVRALDQSACGKGKMHSQIFMTTY